MTKISKVIIFSAVILLILLVTILTIMKKSGQPNLQPSPDLQTKDQVTFNQPPLFGFKATAAFGGQFDQNQKDLAYLLKSVGFQFLEFKVRWNEIEPTDDHYQIAGLKAFTEELKQDDIQPILMVKTGTTDWAVDRTNKKGNQCEKIADLDHPDREYSFAPKSLEQYQEYIKTLVTNLNPDIKYYLIENEAGSCGFFYGSVDDYSEMLKVAYQTIHQVCSDCKVGISNIGFKGPKQKNKTQKAQGKFWLDDILTQDGSQYFDFYSNHCNAGEGKYESGKLREREDDLNLCDLTKLRAEFEELKSLNKEMIITESGVLLKDEVQERVKRNLYALYYGQATMVGSLNVSDLKENREIQKNWQFLIQEMKSSTSIKKINTNPEIDYFQISRTNQPDLHVIWSNQDSQTYQLNERFLKLDENYSWQPLIDNNLILNLSPIILKENN